MNKKVIAILMLGALIIQPTVLASATEVGCSQSLVDEYNKFDKINKIEFSQSFKLGEPEYIVYYYMNNCHYCNKIEDNVIEFAEKMDYKCFYAVPMDLSKNKSGWYNMKEHHTKYDIEIGKLDEDGNVIYYDGESSEKYLNSQDIDYDIVKTDSKNYENYKKRNSNAKPNRVYAVDYTERIDTENTENFKVSGTPTAIWVKNGKILRDAIGTEEVVKLFDDYSDALNN